MSIDPAMTKTMPSSSVQSWLPTRGLVFVFSVFGLSGFSALVYQTAWQRMLGGFAGSDSVAATMIVGAFLFGLGIGSLIGGAFADRLSARGALRVFAACEIGVGGFGCLSRILFHDIFLGQLSSFAGDPLRGFLVVFLALLPPTALMGMSLPLLSRAVVVTVEAASSRIGWLYGLNTVGAAGGALLSGWLLIGTFGFAVTVYAAAAVNFLIGGSILLYARHASPLRQPRSGPLRLRGGDKTSSPVLLWSIMVFVSGFLIISLEIVWFRVLGVLMNSNAYAFSLILAVFLIGDGTGLVFGGAIADKLAYPRRAFQLLQGAMGIYALVSMGALYLAHAGTQLSHLGVDGPYFPSLGGLLLRIAATSVIVFPPAFLLGMSFPITQRVLQDDPTMIGYRVGQVQLCNIFGNTAGALVTGLVFLHWLGTANTLRLIGLAALAFVLVALADRTRRAAVAPGRKLRLWAEGALLAGLLALIAIFPANGAFWSALHGTSLAEGAIAREDRTGVAVLRAGKTGTKTADREPDTLFIGGQAQSLVPFIRQHGGLGVLGPMLHPDPQSVLIIGQGSGGTPIAAGVNPKTQHIRVVDIVAPVFDDMREAAGRSGQDARYRSLRAYYSDPRYVRTVADARHILLTEDVRYDVIEADAVHPFTVLAGQLYSVEFFRLVLSRLKPGGYFVQWMATERTLASFLRVFPYVIRTNVTLIGSASPIDFSHDRAAEMLAGPAGAYLAGKGWRESEVAEWLLSGPQESWTPKDRRNDRDFNTDLFPKDEYARNELKIDLLGADGEE